MRSLIIAWFILLPVLTIIAGINITEEISYGEIIAIGVSILFGIIAVVIWFAKRKKEINRKLNLIGFPDTWRATRMLSKESFEVSARVNVLIPYTSYLVELRVWEAGKPLKMENIEQDQVMGGKKGGLIVTGTTPLALVGNNTNEVEVAIRVTLDGDFSKKSKKRIVPITDFGVAPSTPDTEGSQIE